MIDIDRIIRKNREYTTAEIEATFPDEFGEVEFYSVEHLINALREYRALYQADHVFLRLLPIEHKDTGDERNLVFLGDTRDGRTGVIATPREKDEFEWYPQWGEESALDLVEDSYSGDVEA
jgi:hypothetical protein